MVLSVVPLGGLGLVMAPSPYLPWETALFQLVSLSCIFVNGFRKTLLGLFECDIYFVPRSLFPLPLLLFPVG